jgi:hypothetical protein
MTPDDLLARLDAPLSLRRRLGYLAVLLAGLAGAGLVGSLWATEPGLPPHTAAAFALLVLVGLGWAGFGGWALSRRAPLYARDRVVAGWVALGAWAAGAAGVTGIAAAQHRLPVGLPVLTGALGVAAVAYLVVARRRRAALLRRRQELS